MKLEENCSKIAFQRKSAEEEIKFFRREIGLLNESRTTMASSGRGRQIVLYLGSWKDSIKADERRLAATALGWPIFASSRQGMAIALWWTLHRFVRSVQSATGLQKRAVYRFRRRLAHVRR